MEGAFSKRVRLRITTDAHEPSILFDDSDAPLLPRRAQLLLAVGKEAVVVVTRSTLVMPTLPHLVRQTLVTGVSGLTAPKADHILSIRVQKIVDDTRMCAHVHLTCLSHASSSVLFRIFFSEA